MKPLMKRKTQTLRQTDGHQLIAYEKMNTLNRLIHIYQRSTVSKEKSVNTNEYEGEHICIKIDEERRR